MKRFSITGWWSCPGFQALFVTNDKPDITHIRNSHAFSGIIAVNKNGTISKEHSVIFDEKGPAGFALKERAIFNLKKDEIRFCKIHTQYDGGGKIFYVANRCPGTDCFSGSFYSSTIGEGRIKFFLQEIPEDLFC